MNVCDKLIIVFLTINTLVCSYDFTTQKSLKLEKMATKPTAHISPEIINELKDFKNLIPSAVIDEIVAEHYVVDRSFRTALKYLRSNEFTLLQKQLLNVPEIIDILEFLHLTAANGTNWHMGATKKPTSKAAKLEDGVIKMATNTDIIITNPNTLIAENAKEFVATNKKVPKKQQQQFHIEEHNNVKDYNDDDDDAANETSIERLSNVQQPLVRIILLDNLEVRAKVENKVHHHHHYHKYNSQGNNNNDNNDQDSLGSFTTFVEQVLQHLPQTDYQNMIRDKCKKNLKFSEFYQALRSPEFKPLIEQAKSTANILKIIETFNSHDIDANSLEPIAFKVISWGPDI